MNKNNTPKQVTRTSYDTTSGSPVQRGSSSTTPSQRESKPELRPYGKPGKQGK